LISQNYSVSVFSWRFVPVWRRNGMVWNFTLVLTPMIFLSGVYYPTMQLLFWLQSVSYLLPLSAAVNLVRPLALGARPAARLLGLAVLLGYCVAGFYLVSGLTRRPLLK
jgi:lipooligosaccharide transport system permease protein